MFVCFRKFQFKPHREENGLSHLRHHLERATSEAGCAKGYIGRDPERPEILFLVTSWESKENFFTFQHKLETDPSTSREFLAISKDFMEPLQEEHFTLVD